MSNGAFEGIYSKQGYSKVAETVPNVPVAEPGVVEKTEDELFVENIVEKPISQWNKDEVKRFAELKKLTSGTRNAGEGEGIDQGVPRSIPTCKVAAMIDIERVKRKYVKTKAPFFEEDDFEYYGKEQR